jgi:DNA-binding transcriptional ArsR family regulator
MYIKCLLIGKVDAMRDDCLMPRYVQPGNLQGDPSEAAASVLLANAARVSVLLWLKENPDGGTSGAIAQATGIPPKTTHRHLAGLEELGIVASDTGKAPGEKIPGVRGTYRLIPDALAAALDELTSRLTKSTSR